MIANTIILDADPDLFLEKTIEDLAFIDFCLTILAESFLKNENLIDRSTQCYHLMETEIKFTEVLDAINQSSGTISVVEFPIISEKITNLHFNTYKRQDLLKKVIEDLDDTPQDSNVVSSEEINALLKDF
jgi:hypothetical protein